MSEAMISSAVLVIGAVVFFYNLYFVYLKGKSKEQKFIEKAKRHGNYTKGKCIKTDMQSGNWDSDNLALKSPTCVVTYEYYVNGKMYHKRIGFQNPGVVSINYPLEVTIYFDALNPQKSAIKGQAGKMEQKQQGCLLTIGRTIVVMVIVYQLLVRVF